MMCMWMRKTIILLVAGLLLSAAVTTGTEHEDEQLQPTGEWNGFIACAVGTPVITWQTCSTFDVDPNHQSTHTFSVDEGLHTLVAVMEWETSVISEGDELMLTVEDEGDPATGERHAAVTGDSPVVVEVDDLETEEDGRDLQFRVSPAFDFQFVYQQTFTVTWYEFYEAPPEDFDPVD